MISIDSDIKINKEVYIREILAGALIPWTNSLYHNRDWTFQQDGATSHTANMTQEWCEDHCPWFLTKNKWPPSSFKCFGFLCVICLGEGTTSATSVNALKKRLVKAWAEIDQKIFLAAVDDFPCRLRAVIKSKSNHFE